MTEKQFFFSVGLPRSGSSLLTTLLNENKNIYASHGSCVSNISLELDKLLPNLPVVSQKLELKGVDSVLKNLYPTFFSFTNKPFVIDKLDRMIEPKLILTYLELANPNYKVIVTIRPILEILASFITLCRFSPDVNIYDKSMKESNFSVMSYRNIDDSRCDYLMSETGPIQRALSWLLHAKQNPQNFKIISYEDIVTRPQETMNKVYDFIGAPQHNHNLNNIKSINMSQSDFELYGMPTLHAVRKTISSSKTNTEILSSYVKDKYGATLDFLNLF